MQPLPLVLPALTKGRYRARLAQDHADLTRAQALRFRSFRSRRGLATGDDLDQDGFDALCQHVLVEEIGTGQLVCCYRLLGFAAGATLAPSYAAQVYDLTALQHFAGAKLELGRFCLHPDLHDPDILRLAWGAMARLVDDCGVKLLFGCSSFEGADPALHRAALALLPGYLAPAQWQPGSKAPQICRFAPSLAGRAPDSRAMLALPTLLRTYLAMGGWVSDHAVIDRDLDTLHVFTGVEIDRIPAARARALRAVARPGD